MIIIIFLLFFFFVIFGSYLCFSHKFSSRNQSLGTVLLSSGLIGSLISFICLIVLTCNVLHLSVIDTEIEMYEEENTRIENQISECVKQYQLYESEIFIESSTESSITLVSLYPELKSDTLVAKQIEVYISNNEKIKSLKQEKINGNLYRWWLYFGNISND